MQKNINLNKTVGEVNDHLSFLKPIDYDLEETPIKLRKSKLEINRTIFGKSEKSFVISISDEI